MRALGERGLTGTTEVRCPEPDVLHALAVGLEVLAVLIPSLNHLDQLNRDAGGTPECEVEGRVRVVVAPRGPRPFHLPAGPQLDAEQLSVAILCLLHVPHDDAHV